MLRFKVVSEQVFFCIRSRSHVLSFPENRPQGEEQTWVVGTSGGIWKAQFAGTILASARILSDLSYVRATSDIHISLVLYTPTTVYCASVATRWAII